MADSPLKPRRVVAASCLAIFLLVGCGGSPWPTAPVHGTVTLDGKPLDNGRVTFVPKAGRGASGIIQSDGTFKMETLNIVARDKTRLGHYHILQREYHLAVENKF